MDTRPEKLESRSTNSYLAQKRFFEYESTDLPPQIWSGCINVHRRDHLYVYVLEGHFEKTQPHAKCVPSLMALALHDCIINNSGASSNGGE